MREHLMNTHRGILISIEGIHGSGKSTFSKILIQNLEKYGINPIYTNDQGGTETGKKIRKLNLKEGSKIDVITEALLIAAARRQTVSEIIKPNLTKGELIICERFTDAYYAFQGSARGLPIEFLEEINLRVSEEIYPNLTILLDLEPAIALSRLEDQSKHRIEKESIEFHSKVREGYLSQAKKYPDRIKIINAAQPIENVLKQGLIIVKNFLNLDGV